MKYEELTYEQSREENKKLLPCPFCNSSAEILPQDKGFLMARCIQCSANVWDYTKYSETIIARWNCRIHKREYILCSANWYKDIELKKVFDCNVLPINCDRGIVFCGLRHAHAMYSMCSMTGLRQAEVGEYEHGFLTNLNRFVSREEGLQIALAAHQIKDLSNVRGKRLHSEDLY